MTLAERMHSTVTARVDAGELPGAAWLVRSGGEVARGAAGIGVDSVFRISSMTKPIVAALAMTLIDDGTLTLDTPIDDLLPELADRRVLLDPAGPLTETRPADRPILVQDVLEFRLGLGMDFTGPWPGAHPHCSGGRRAGGRTPCAATNPAPDEWMRMLGTVPLAYQPGERWLYHTGASVLGVLIARATGRSLPDVLADRILAPLAMTSTGFGVPAGAAGEVRPALGARRGRRSARALRPGRRSVGPTAGVPGRR